MTESNEKQPDKPAGKPAALDLDTVILRRIVSKDNRYELGAYRFMYEALGFTQHVLGRDVPESPIEERHVTGRELLNGIRRLATKQFGFLAPTVFRTWGVQKTADFGKIIFNLVEA